MQDIGKVTISPSFHFISSSPVPPITYYPLPISASSPLVLPVLLVATLARARERIRLP